MPRLTESSRVMMAPSRAIMLARPATSSALRKSNFVFRKTSPKSHKTNAHQNTRAKLVTTAPIEPEIIMVAGPPNFSEAVSI